jgi:hypothetical protein
MLLILANWATKRGFFVIRRSISRKLRFQIFDCREAGFQVSGQTFRRPIFGYANGFRRVPQRVLRYDRILGLAQDDADARLVVRMAEKVVDGGQVDSSSLRTPA